MDINRTFAQLSARTAPAKADGPGPGGSRARLGVTKMGFPWLKDWFQNGQRNSVEMIRLIK